MTSEMKEFLRGIMANAIGTLVAAGVLAALAFFAGKTRLLVEFWKELSITLFLLFALVTNGVWLRRLLKLEERVNDLEVQAKPSVDYSPEIKKVEQNIKAELIKKADRNSVPNVAGFKVLKRRVKELEVFKYRQMGQKGELISLIELLKEDIDDDNWNIEMVLEDIEEAINGKTLESGMITDIEEQLCRLDDKPKYNVLVKKVRKHYQN